MPQPISLKAETAWEACRTFHLPALSHQADAMALDKALEDAEGKGVLGFLVDLERKRVRILYNATITNFAEIADVLENTGFPVRDSWWQRVKYGWYGYLDENTRSNARAPAPPCCNKPPK